MLRVVKKFLQVQTQVHLLGAEKTFLSTRFDDQVYAARSFMSSGAMRQQDGNDPVRVASHPRVCEISNRIH